MLKKSKMDRINFLAKKKKDSGLNKEEAEEQESLRREYLTAFRKSFSSQLDRIKWEE